MRTSLMSHHQLQLKPISSAPRDGTFVWLSAPMLSSEKIAGFFANGTWQYLGFGGLDGEISPIGEGVIEGWFKMDDPTRH